MYAYGAVKQIRQWSAAYAHVDLNERAAYMQTSMRRWSQLRYRPHQDVVREYYVLWCSAIKLETHHPPSSLIPGPHYHRSHWLQMLGDASSCLLLPPPRHCLSIRSFIRKNIPWPVLSFGQGAISIRREFRTINQRNMHRKGITLKLMVIMNDT